MMNLMRLSALYTVKVLTILCLTGCSFATDAIFPIFSGDEPVSVNSSSTMERSTPIAMPVPTAPVASRVSMTNSDTGTFVNRKVTQFSAELNQLRATLSRRNSQLKTVRSTNINNAAAYHGVVGGIKSRLQVGTTPGNPKLMSQWRSSQGQLNKIEGDIASMNQLAAEVDSDAAMSSYLLDSVLAAYGLSGAVDEDHRRLRALEDEVNQTIVTIKRLGSELKEDIARQQQFVANEREGLLRLVEDINTGQLYVSQNNITETPQLSSSSPGDFSQRRPLVIIRFDRKEVTYEPALYQAVSRALERRPDAVFDLVAVNATGGKDTGKTLSYGSARRNAERVLGSLSNMGLPSDRIMLSAMTSPSAKTSEVHIYVR